MPMLSSLVLAAVLQKTITQPHVRSRNEMRDGYYELDLAWYIFPETHPLASLANKAAWEPIGEVDQEFLNSLQSFNEKPTSPWTLAIKPTLSLYRTNLISILYDRYEYTGGAHPNSMTYTFNIGLINGEPKRLKLGDILADGVKESDVLEGFVRPRLSKLRRDRTGEGVDSLPIATHEKFIITKNGLTFPFDKYSVGAYAEGDYLLKLRWTELRGLINKSIIPEAVP